MRRRLPAIVVVVLLAATAVAFVRTQQQKLERSPIGTLDIDPRPFSPVCRCPNRSRSIGIRFRRGDTVTLEIVDDDERRVRRLTGDERVRAGDHSWVWDGFDDDGELAPDGVYRPRITLDSAARTFLMRNPVTLDTRAPRVTGLVVAPRRFSPDGDRRLDLVSIGYDLDERAHALLEVDGRAVERTRLRRQAGTRRWNGKQGGRSLPPGRYALSLRAEDWAGNVGPASPRVPVEIRYVELGRSVVRVRARARFGVRVLTDARSVRWRFARARGAAEPGLLILRAPRRPGRYTLFVTANGHADRAEVVVRPRPAPRRRAAS